MPESHALCHHHVPEISGHTWNAVLFVKECKSILLSRWSRGCEAPHIGVSITLPKEGAQILCRTRLNNTPIVAHSISSIHVLRPSACKGCSKGYGSGRAPLLSRKLTLFPSWIQHYYCHQILSCCRRTALQHCSKHEISRVQAFWQLPRDCIE